MVVYLYIILLLIIFFILFNSIKESIFLPFKIRSVITIVIIGLLFRYFSIFSLFIVKNIRYLYMLKIPLFLNIICIPVTALTVFFIFIRNNKFNYLYIQIITFISLGLYLAIMYNIHDLYTGIVSDFALGYTLGFYGHYLWIYAIYAIINVGSFILALMCLNKKNVNKNGFVLMIFASIITSIEMILVLMNINLFPQYLLGEAMWILVMAYAIRRVTKRV